MQKTRSAGLLKYIPIFFVQVMMVLMTAMTQTARADEAIKTVDGVSTFFLKNGMQVVAIPDHRAPVVTHMVWYRVGAADEKPGKSGIAHFLEHLMFKGTKDIAPGEFSKIVARNGGQDNAFTAQDYTGYYQRNHYCWATEQRHHSKGNGTDYGPSYHNLLPSPHFVR